MTSLIEFIDSNIKGEWSPEQILGWIH